MCLDHVLLIHSSTGGHLGPFYHLALRNNAPGNLGVQISLQVPTCNSFDYTLRSVIAGLCDNSVFSSFWPFLAKGNGIHSPWILFMPFLQASHYLATALGAASHPLAYTHVDPLRRQGPVQGNRLHPWVRGG